MASMSSTPRLLQPVELGGVLAQDLAAALRPEREHLLLDGVERRRVQARRVREVGLEEDVVLTDPVHEVLDVPAVLLEPERGEPVVLEVLRRLAGELLGLLGGVL